MNTISEAANCICFHQASNEHSSRANFCATKWIAHNFQLLQLMFYKNISIKRDRNKGLHTCVHTWRQNKISASFYYKQQWEDLYYDFLSVLFYFTNFLCFDFTNICHAHKIKNLCQCIAGFALFSTAPLVFRTLLKGTSYDKTNALHVSITSTFKE